MTDTLLNWKDCVKRLYQDCFSPCLMFYTSFIPEFVANIFMLLFFILGYSVSENSNKASENVSHTFVMLANSIFGR